MGKRRLRDKIQQIAARPQTQLLGERAMTAALVTFPLVVAAAGAARISKPRPGAMVLAVATTAVGITGVTAGWHRLLTHRSYKTTAAVRETLTWMGASSLEGTPTSWVAIHRRHHQVSDAPGDPHSPKWDGDEQLGTLPGLWHAHTGWLFGGYSIDNDVYAPDLVADEQIARISRYWWVAPIVANIALPLAVGYVTGGKKGAANYLLWAGAFKTGMVHHVTWSINSICHTWGVREFRTRDSSRNVSWLAIVSAGESWHNTHHAFPNSARHGAEAGQLDLTAELIATLEKAGLAWDVRWPEQRKLDAKRIDHTA